MAVFWPTWPTGATDAMGRGVGRTALMLLARLRDFVLGRDVPTWKRALALAAVAYVLSPIDAVPDVLPVVGWLDDLGALLTLVATVRSARSTPSAVVEGQVLRRAPAR